MKKSYKNFLVIALLALILSSTGVFAADTDTASQDVILSITDSYNGVAAIRIFDDTNGVNPDVTFTGSTNGDYVVATPGLEATGDTGSYEITTLDEQAGGNLQYTVRGYTGAYKITVHTATENYTTESLYVKVAAPTVSASGSSADGTLGSVVSAGTEGIAVPLTTATDVITGIGGSNTFTGIVTADGAGAPLTYGFNEEPSVETIAVTYTILADA
jgi:hypothetical protein